MEGLDYCLLDGLSVENIEELGDSELTNLWINANVALENLRNKIDEFEP